MQHNHNIERGRRGVKIAENYPFLHYVICKRTELDKEHHLQWETLTDSQLKQLNIFFKNNAPIKEVICKQYLHPTYLELIEIINSELALHVFEFRNLSLLLDLTNLTTALFLQIMSRARADIELLDQILNFETVKIQLQIKPEALTQLLSLNHGSLQDLLARINVNPGSDNIIRWLKDLSHFCIQNNLQPSAYVARQQPAAMEPVVTEAVSHTAAPANINLNLNPKPRIYTETIAALEKYTNKISDYIKIDDTGKKQIDYEFGFCIFFKKTRSIGREANHNLAQKWLRELSDPRVTDYESHLAKVFDPVETKRSRQPSRWFDNLVGITSTDLRNIEKQVMQHIKSAPKTRITF